MIFLILWSVVCFFWFLSVVLKNWTTMVLTNGKTYVDMHTSCLLHWQKLTFVMRLVINNGPEIMGTKVVCLYKLKFSSWPCGKDSEKLQPAPSPLSPILLMTWITPGSFKPANYVLFLCSRDKENWNQRCELIFQMMTARKW